jgi:gentisate 1,2-dioxygenase
LEPTGSRADGAKTLSCAESVYFAATNGAQSRLDWEDKDVFTVPTWTFYEHVNCGDRPAFLFSFSDAPVMKALSLYREETRA